VAGQSLSIDEERSVGVTVSDKFSVTVTASRKNMGSL
jgi:hypothetical protein